MTDRLNWTELTVYTWPTKKPINILAIDDILQMAMNDSIFELKLVPSMVTYFCVWMFVLGLSCCSQEKSQTKASWIADLFINELLPIWSSELRSTVRCEGIQTLLVLSINSSFKDKDNEDGGKSKASEPNVQISHEELIINIKKYVLWKKKHDRQTNYYQKTDFCAWWKLFQHQISGYILF